MLHYSCETGQFAWFPFEPEIRDEEVACFCCGQEMEPLPGMLTRWCPDCEVTEARLAEPPPLVISWEVEGVKVVDHGAVHCPSPA